MTKKHFQMLADAIKVMYAELTESKDRIALYVLAVSVSDQLPFQQRAQFIKACGF